MRARARGSPPTVGEWLARKRRVEERRAILALSLERATTPREGLPVRAMTEAEARQRPRALLDHRSARAGGTLRALPADPYRAKRMRRDE